MMIEAEDKTPKSELDQRIEKFRRHLENHHIDGALILQNVDQYYFSGTIQQGQLYIPAEGEPILMVNKNYERALTESSLDNIVYLGNPKEVPDIIENSGIKSPKVLGMEYDVLPVQVYRRIKKIFKDIDTRDVSHLIRSVRAVKSNYEIEMMRKAAILSDQVASLVPSLVREGITEVELAGKVEAEARKLGHQGIVRMRIWGGEMFYGHLMAGAAAAVPSFLASPTGGQGLSPAVAQGSSFKTIQAHEPILVDYVFAAQGYLSDHTRIFSIGKLPEKLVKGHHAMLDVQETVKKAAKPGVKAGDLYDIAIQRAEELGVGENFLGVGQHKIRFVGHGLGLEIDEYPFLAQGQKLVLEENMTLALEPKLIYPGEGVVGIENIHIVTENGLEQLNTYDEDIQVL